MTDDGYGRKRPCSAGYKAANPQWRAGDSCFTDEATAVTSVFGRLQGQAQK